jgi:hypothetical protein
VVPEVGQFSADDQWPLGFPDGLSDGAQRADDAAMAVDEAGLEV